MGSINLEEVNWLAVVVAALGTFMIGGAWYTALFGKAWQKAHGFNEEQVKQMQASTSPAVFFGSMLVCYALMAICVGLVAQAAGVDSLAGGAMAGMVLWVLVAAIGWTNHVPTNVANAGYLINVTYQFIYLVGTSAVIGAWQ
jgi:hypothetical protein